MTVSRSLSRSSLGVVVAVGAAAALGGLGASTSAAAGVTAAASRQQLTAYVVETFRNRVVPIVVATRERDTPIPVGARPAAIAITPGARFAFVANSGDGTVTPITLATGTAGTPIRVGGVPTGIAITPDGAKAYVGTGAAVVPITVATRTAGKPIALPRRAVGIAITPDGATAFVTNDNSQAGAVTPIKLATRQLGAAISVPSSPTGIAITPDGRRAYVATFDEGTLTPIDVATGRAGTPIFTPPETNAVSIGPAGRTVFVGSKFGVDAINIRTNDYASSLYDETGRANAGLAITPDGSTGFVSDDAGLGDSRVLTFSTGQLQEGPSIDGLGPGPIAITPAQAPIAALTVNVARHGRPSHLDASGSVARGGRIVSYFWYFGDGTKATTTVPTIDHMYAAAGSYTAKVKVADSNHTSTLRVFTGQTLSRNGGPSAKTSRHVSVG